MALSYSDQSLPDDVWIGVYRNRQHIGTVLVGEDGKYEFLTGGASLSESDLLELWTKVSILNKDFYDD